LPIMKWCTRCVVDTLCGIQERGVSSLLIRKFMNSNICGILFIYFSLFKSILICTMHTTHNPCHYVRMINDMFNFCHFV
jgi:hypothetical protein